MSLAYMSTYPDAATPALRLNEDGDPITRLKFPNMQIVGMTATTPLTLLNLNYTVLRTEVARFFDEPFFIEKQNFKLGVPIPTRDVIRGVVGFDHNQWLRFLNPANTFALTRQLFYTAIHGRPWLPSHLAALTNTIGLQLYMRPVDARMLAGPDGICRLTPHYSDGL
jgi:hypothetical protein